MNPICPPARSLWREFFSPFFAALVVFAAVGGRAQPAGTLTVPRFAPHEVTLAATGSYANPYTELEAEATLVEPDGKTTRHVPLFWDGGQTWRFRFAPDRVGAWQWTVQSADRGLNGSSGKFECVASKLRGSILPMVGAGHHFQYQNGEPMWFLGDTAWAYVMDSSQEKHDRATAERYAANRATQGFNAIHLMLLGEIGWGNRGGPPWTEIAKEKINPAYFQEIDERVAYANARGLVTGLVLAWSIKMGQEPYAWDRMPGMPARERYARYATARFAAYNVYFLVAGEWSTAIRHRPVGEEELRQNFTRLGDVVKASDAHARMIGIHTTMRTAGSSREWNQQTKWMSFGDYQQNYLNLHGAILQSRVVEKPAVNSEYAYFIRKSRPGGNVTKAHSYTLADIRGATWDIAMAGGYVVTGFGSTYLGGARSFTTFLPDDPENTPWIEQAGVLKEFFTALDFWRLEPHDELLSSPAPRTGDRGSDPNAADIQTAMTQVPATTYWCLADVGKTYVVYVRGTAEPVRLALPPAGGGNWRAEQFDPRSGARQPLSAPTGAAFEFRAPDQQDWVVLLRRG